MKKLANYQTIVEIFTRFRKENAEPKGELEHTNAFTLLVAVVLSAQSTDVGVNLATRKLFQVADTPEKMLELGEERLIPYIKTIGLYKNKARNIIKLSGLLMEKFDGQVPSSREALESLPGVGRKTANVVLNMWFKHPAQAVDTHISGLAIERALHQARMSWKWRGPSRIVYRLNSSSTPITG